MEYRGYLLEEKQMIVGWQIVVRKDGDFVRNGEVRDNRNNALSEAYAYVDGLIAAAH